MGEEKHEVGFPMSCPTIIYYSLTALPKETWETGEVMFDGCFPGSQNRVMFVWMLMASITVGVVGTSNVPGVKMSQLEVWENSANPGVFGLEFSDEYLHFQTYGLTALSDAGLLDHLLTELGPNVLRVIDSVGGQTGIQVQKASENARATTRSSSGDGDSGDVVAVIGLTLLAILAKAKAMVKRMLRRGPPSRLLDNVCPDSNSNVLNWFIRMDKRYFPITVEMQNKSRRASMVGNGTRRKISTSIWRLGNNCCRI